MTDPTLDLENQADQDEQDKLARLGKLQQPDQSLIAGPTPPQPTNGLDLPKPSPELGQRRSRDEAEYKRVNDSGSGISQLPRAARIPLKVLDTIGSVISPTTAELIPGTELHHRAVLGGLRGDIDEDIQQQGREAQTAQAGAATAKDLADAQAKLNPPAQIKEEQLLYDKAGNAIGYRDEKGAYHGADDPSLPPGVKDVLAAAKPKPEKQTPAHVNYDAGIPVSVTDRDGTVYDVNDPKVPPTLKPLVDSANRAHSQHVAEETNKQAASQAGINSRLDKTEDFQRSEKGREHITKLEDDYGAASEKADVLRATVAAAQNGNKMAGQLQPLLATLGVTTMEGVKRINSTELSQVAGAGSLLDQIRGKVGKLTEGQPIPPDVQQDLVKLADMLQQSAYKKYKTSYDSIVKRYQLDDEEPLPGPQANSSQGGGGKDLGPAPAGKAEGSTGKLPDGTKIVIKGGRIVAQ